MSPPPGQTFDLCLFSPLSKGGFPLHSGSSVAGAHAQEAARWVGLAALTQPLAFNLELLGVRICSSASGFGCGVCGERESIPGSWLSSAPRAAEGGPAPPLTGAPTLRSWGALQSQHPPPSPAPPSPPTCANGPSNRKRKDLSRLRRPWLPLACVSVPVLRHVTQGPCQFPPQEVRGAASAGPSRTGLPPQRVALPVSLFCFSFWRDQESGALLSGPGRALEGRGGGRGAGAPGDAGAGPASPRPRVVSPTVPLTCSFLCVYNCLFIKGGEVLSQ